jgi:nucleotide-binding universal stress UspA family protein
MYAESEKAFTVPKPSTSFPEYRWGSCPARWLGISAGRQIVTYAILMVRLELGRANTALLRIAGDLAARFHAGVIGIAACQPMRIIYDEGYLSGNILARDRDEREQEIKEAEAEFRGALQTQVINLAWRSTITSGALSDYLVREARSADLFITGVDQNASLFDTSRHVIAGDLVMQLGRPVLIVPAVADKLTPERILIGWKDTRESRRAAFDALPLLKKAAHVAVVEIAAKEDLAATRARLDDVVGWLGRHGVVSASLAWPSNGDDATQLNAIAQEQGADVIVAGAYGHSRLREWALGGVTRELLLRADRCTLVSH